MKCGGDVFKKLVWLISGGLHGVACLLFLYWWVNDGGLLAFALAVFLLAFFWAVRYWAKKSARHERRCLVLLGLVLVLVGVGLAGVLADLSQKKATLRQAGSWQQYGAL